MTIKHLLYTQLCAFKYTKGACVVFFRFRNSPMKIFYVVETVASISDQREYQRKIMWQKIFVFKEYIQRHVLRAVKYLKKNPLGNIIYF